jgi:hypothetical protein
MLQLSDPSEGSNSSEIWRAWLEVSQGHIRTAILKWYYGRMRLMLPLI